MPPHRAQLDAPFPLTPAQLAFYDEHGHIKLKHVLPADLLEHFRRSFQSGRDLEISGESEITLQQALQRFRAEDSGFDLGDVSFHSGRTFHRAGANSTRPREVMTIIYRDENIRLSPPKNKNHLQDMAAWMPGLHPGDHLSSPLNPILYTRASSSVSS
jgi:ectoine hydroxylase-related dioxygenase (phytanoyl-CoA dioxygenase family)